MGACGDVWDVDGGVFEVSVEKGAWGFVEVDGIGGGGGWGCVGPPGGGVMEAAGRSDGGVGIYLEMIVDRESPMLNDGCLLEYDWKTVGVFSLQSRWDISVCLLLIAYCSHTRIEVFTLPSQGQKVSLAL